MLGYSPCNSDQPDGSLPCEMIIRDYSCTPIVDADVTIRFSPATDSLICWCSTAPSPHIFHARTDAQGRARFNIAAGGCLANDDPRIPGANRIVAEVFSNDIKLVECGLVSPDAVDNSGHGALDPGGWSPGANCTVGLADGVFHTTPPSLPMLMRHRVSESLV